jgi:hypothetical protein
VGASHRIVRSWFRSMRRVGVSSASTGVRMASSEKNLAFRSPRRLESRSTRRWVELEDLRRRNIAASLAEMRTFRWPSQVIRPVSSEPTKSSIVRAELLRISQAQRGAHNTAVFTPAPRALRQLSAGVLDRAPCRARSHRGGPPHRHPCRGSSDCRGGSAASVLRLACGSATSLRGRTGGTPRPGQTGRSSAAARVLLRTRLIGAGRLGGAVTVRRSQVGGSHRTSESRPSPEAGTRPGLPPPRNIAGNARMVDGAAHGSCPNLHVATGPASSLHKPLNADGDQAWSDRGGLASHGGSRPASTRVASPARPGT